MLLVAADLAAPIKEVGFVLAWKHGDDCRAAQDDTLASAQANVVCAEGGSDADGAAGQAAADFRIGAIAYALAIADDRMG